MAPDIVLLDAEWPSRALLRAQLIEDGFDVLATDTWTTMRRYLRHSSTVMSGACGLASGVTPMSAAPDTSA